ncbi:MAG: hypothetical protein MZV70_67660 [Desulfobacterales bacterium]|nr:hypothetical protein [Desulfobacterales bacterium]
MTPCLPLGTELEAQWDARRGGRKRHRPPDPLPAARGLPGPDRRPGGRDRRRPLSRSCSPASMAHWTSPVFKHALLVVHRALGASRDRDHAGAGPAGGRHLQLRHRRAGRRARRPTAAWSPRASFPALHQPQLLHQHGGRQGRHR